MKRLITADDKKRIVEAAELEVTAQKYTLRAAERNAAESAGTEDAAEDQKYLEQRREILDEVEAELVAAKNMIVEA